MAKYLIDNNVISHFFANSLPQNGMELILEAIDQTQIISVVTEIETLSWVRSDKHKEAILKLFVKDAIVLPLTQDVVNQCIALRRSRSIKTPDAILAATAMVHQLTLLTSDRVFHAIPGLKAMDPGKL
jgi:predicted nucleic acid-binding protein